MMNRTRWNATLDGKVPARATAVINGEWIVDRGDVIEVFDPGLGTAMGEITDAPINVMDEAIESAAKTYRDVWRKVDGVERGRILMRISQTLLREKEYLATLEAVDTGKPLSQARGDIDISARYFEYYGGIADKIYGETLPQKDLGHFAYTVREPHGVVGHITPWNAPLNQLCRGVAPSLAAGNVVVAKPSEIAPFSPLVAAMLFVESGLPAGVMNVVSGFGPTVGEALVTHPKTHHLSFTGSVKTGQEILRKAASKIMPCNLELGGKSPAIVFADANLEIAAKAAATAMVRNSGQSCFLLTRFFVHRSVHDQFAELILKEVASIKMGHALDDPDLGPLASQAQLERVIGFLKSANEENATVLAGGSRASEMGGGYFFKPTLLTGVTNQSTVARNEIFGPVQSLLVFDSEEEAIELANDSEYGLAAGVFTKDVSRAHRVAGKIQSGQVMVNRFPLGGVDTPFGGYKSSGMGREKGLEAIRGYTQLKTVIMDVK